MKKLRVDVWSDIACPWCYVGKRRLEAALERFAHRAEVEVHWRAFELDPGAPPMRDASQPYAKRLADKYGVPVARGEAMIRQMTETAAREGLDFHFEKIRPGNTFDAHRLLHFAAERGKEDVAKERLLRAYFVEGAAIGDRDTLVALGGEIGLDTEEVRAALASDAYAREVRADEAQARAHGISGVPFFVLAGEVGVSGAQPPDALLQVLEEVWRELPELVATPRSSSTLRRWHQIASARSFNETGAWSRARPQSIGATGSGSTVPPAASASPTSSAGRSSPNVPAGRLTPSATRTCESMCVLPRRCIVPDRPAAIDLLRAFAPVMKRRRLRWYVFGAQAVVAYGRPRMTADVNVTVALGTTLPKELLADLRKAGFAPRLPRFDEILAQSRVLPLVHLATSMPLDLVIAGPGFEDEFLARAKRVDLGGIRVPVISVEDLLATKILAGRPKDLDDVRGILLERAGQIELARTRDVLSALESALGQSDLTPVLDRLLPTTARRPRRK